MLLIDTIIFDLDGTLINSRTYVGRGTLDALEELFSQKGEKLPPVDEAYILAQMGKPMETFYRNILPEGYKHWIKEMIPIGEKHLVQAIEQGKAELFPNALTVLGELKSRGIRLGIASNCGRPYLDALTHYFRLDNFVERSYCLAYEPTKTAMVTRILKETQSRTALMVGDRASDIEAAHANRIKCIVFTLGFGTPEEIKAGDYFIKDLREIPVLLNQMTK